MVLLFIEPEYSLSSFSSVDLKGSRMETKVRTQSDVTHIEQDLFNLTNLLYSDGNSLKSGDMIVVGLAEAFPGYIEGIGEIARFCHITGFVQLNSSTVLIVDSYNHCVRLVDRNSRQTLGFSGECTWPDFDSTHF